MNCRIPVHVTTTVCGPAIVAAARTGPTRALVPACAADVRVPPFDSEEAFR